MMGKIGRSAAIGGAALAAGTAVVGKALLEIAESAELMRANIVKGTGASGESLDALFVSAKNVLGSVPDSAAMVSTALADVNTFFGETGGKLENTSELFLDFARLTGTDVASAIANIDGAMTQFGTNDSIDEVLGDVTRIAQTTGVPVARLLEQIKTFGPIFSNANFSMEETSALIGQLTQAGVDLTRVGPALNAFFRKTAEAGEDPQVALAAMVDTISSAANTTDALNVATAAFGSEGAQRMVSAIRSGNFDLDDFNGLLGEGAGLVDAQTAATETFGEKWAQIKNQVFVKLMPVATRLFDLLLAGMDALGPLVDKVVAWFKEELQPGIENVLVDIEEIFATFTAIFRAIWSVFGEAITVIVTTMFVHIKNQIDNALKIIKGVWDVFAGVFTGDWERVWGGVKDVFGGLWDGIVNQIKLLPSIILGLLPLMKNAGVSVLTGLLNGMKGVLTSGTGFVKDLVSGIWSSFKEMINTKFIDRINDAIPNTLVIDYFPDINLPDNPLKRLAMGGVSGGGRTLVGERGPEVLTLPKGSRVEPNHGAGMNAGGNVTVNVSTNADPFAIGREIAWRLSMGGV